MEKEKEDNTGTKKTEDIFEPLRKVITEAKLSLGKKCEYCGCYDGIHRSDCLFMLRLK
ncbi:MAG: hypothetical protein WC428_00015 [Candidatus Paceibacterota bacterium]|jgi:hypothetical protein